MRAYEYVSIRQHTPAYVSIRQLLVVVDELLHASVCIRQHTPAYASMRQLLVVVDELLHASVCIGQHTPAYASIRQHTSAYVFVAELCSRMRTYAGVC
jgi:hypothetical protein